MFALDFGYRKIVECSLFEKAFNEASKFEGWDLDFSRFRLQVLGFLDLEFRVLEFSRLPQLFIFFNLQRRVIPHSVILPQTI
jgi:hypothetical protein